MASKRMFSMDIVDSDVFMKMPLSTQALYIHLSMRADDDGFVKNPRKIQKMIGASNRDFKMLISKQFIVIFDSGIIVIKHWKINNIIRSDRYKPTSFTQEKSMLAQEKNGAYTMLKNNGIPDDNQVGTLGIPDDNQWVPQVKVKDSINNTHTIEKSAFGSFQNVSLTDEEYVQLKKQFPRKYNKLIEKFSVGLKTYGYKYDNHYAAILLWEENDKKKSGKTKQKKTESTFDASQFESWDNYEVPDLTNKKGEKKK